MPPSSVPSTSAIMAEVCARVRARASAGPQHHQLRRHELHGERAAGRGRIAGDGACDRGGGGLRRHLAGARRQHRYARRPVRRGHGARGGGGAAQRRAVGARPGRRRRDRLPQRRGGTAARSRTSRRARQRQRDHRAGRHLGRAAEGGRTRAGRQRGCRGRPPGPLSTRAGTVVAVTGATDYVVDGERVVAITGGHPISQDVTGTGCATSALVGACLAVSPPAEAAIAALSLLKTAAARAADGDPGPGTFAVRLLDTLHAVSRGV